MVKGTEAMSEMPGQRACSRREEEEKHLRLTERRTNLDLPDFLDPVSIGRGHVNASASECCFCVVFPLQRIDHKMHLRAGKLVPHLVSMRALAGPRVAKYGTEGIRGNLLIRAKKKRQKRLNLRSCNCKWRWYLSEGPSVSLQG